LVAVWREGLLARAVLRGETRGYRQHPQLVRFRQHPSPLSAINNYLGAIFEESRQRDYTFNARKIGPVRNRDQIVVTTGQLDFELGHLRSKMAVRAPSALVRLPHRAALLAHPLFSVRVGPVADWERDEAARIGQRHA
jgi:hypothetical protein